MPKMREKMSGHDSTAFTLLSVLSAACFAVFRAACQIDLINGIPTAVEDFDLRAKFLRKHDQLVQNSFAIFLRGQFRAPLSNRFRSNPRANGIVLNDKIAKTVEYQVMFINRKPTQNMGAMTSESADAFRWRTWWSKVRHVSISNFSKMAFRFRHRSSLRGNLCVSRKSPVAATEIGMTPPPFC